EILPSRRRGRDGNSACPFSFKETSMSMWTRWLNRLKHVIRENRRLAGKTDVRKRPRQGLGIESLEARTLLSASVWLDKPDYAPGSTAVINGSGFQAGEVVQLQVVRTDGQPDYPAGNLPWQVKDGDTSFVTPYQDASGMWHAPDLDGKADGNIQTTWYVESQYADAKLQLTAAGLDSHLIAQTTFTHALTSPSRFTASAVPNNTSTIQLSWTDTSDQETYFLIQRSTNSTFPNNGTDVVATVLSTTTTGTGTSYSYTDSGLSPG